MKSAMPTVKPNKNGYEISLGDKSFLPSIKYELGGTLAELSIDGILHSIKVAPVIGGYRLRLRGVEQVVRVMNSRIAELSDLRPDKLPADTSKFLLCPMPGLMVSILVSEGDIIEEGQALAMVEAMKMENSIKAPADATIKAVKITAGDKVEKNQVMILLA